jgi:ABC-type transport system involved in multi-copper enzyme maturation permease subunit
MLIGASVISSLLLYVKHTGGELTDVALMQLGILDANLLAWINLEFHRTVSAWALLMAAITGAPLIAEDRRAKAMPLYFSRPLSHFDYVMGKLATVGLFLGLLLLLPPVATYLVEISLSTKEGVVLAQLPTLGSSLLAGVALLVPLAALSLGVSALNDRPGHAALGTLSLFLAFPLSLLLARKVFDDSVWYAISPLSCARRIAHHLLGDRPPVPGQLSGMDVSHAWLGIAAWTALGLALLVWRIRRVEVVT